jgi:hypothetical protein
MVDERQSDTVIYSNDCIALQEELNDTCCGDDTNTGNPSPTGSPPGGDTCCEAPLEATETTERRAGSATIVGSTLGAFFGIGLVVVFLMKRFSSNPKPYRPSPLMPLPKDDTESISPSTNTAPPPYQPLAFEHPPAAPTIVVRPPLNQLKAEESGPIYESSVYYETKSIETPVARLVVPCISEPPGYYSEQPPPYASK